MRVGILGTGDVGRVLGVGFARKGHEVKMGSRDPKNAKLAEFVKQAGPRGSGGTFAEAAAFGDVILLATLWTGTENALKLAGAKNFAGKVVMDATNPLVFAPNAPPALERGWNDSAGEQVQRWLPEAKVVKVYNIVGNSHMVDPQFPGGPPDMFICGNDAGAKATVTRICADFGWPTIDIGGVEASRLLEPMCVLWVLYGIRTGSWNHAFKLLRK
jgi:predicted dinucleotide-binding enzyme